MPPPVEAPYEIVNAGPQLRSVAWRQLGFVAFAVVAALLPLGLALALAV